LDNTKQICSRCIYDSSTASIEFDQLGICNYCHQVDRLITEYGTGSTNGEKSFDSIVNEMKSNGRGKKYDCIIGVSGGTDSSFLVKTAIDKWGLRPLAVHYDNTWNSAVATMNIHKVLTALNVDLETYVVSNIEADDIFRAFFHAGVAEIEASTDLAYAYVLRLTAAKWNVNYVLEGHSFTEEGITPLGRNYFDGKYISSIHKEFGSLPMKSYPLMTLMKFIYFSAFKSIKFIRPLWYISYVKSEARKMLETEFSWKYYGGHHLENRMTSFYHSIYLPQKFGTDLRSNTLSAQVRNGKLKKDIALKEINSPPPFEPFLEEYFIERLGISRLYYDTKMKEKPRSWQEFPTYKREFEMLRPLFKILAAQNKVTKAFYLKYCFTGK